MSDPQSADEPLSYKDELKKEADKKAEIGRLQLLLLEVLNRKGWDSRLTALRNMPPEDAAAVVALPEVEVGTNHCTDNLLDRVITEATPAQLRAVLEIGRLSARQMGEVVHYSAHQRDKRHHCRFQPLIRAAQLDRLDMVDELLEQGVDPNIRIKARLPRGMHEAYSSERMVCALDFALNAGNDAMVDKLLAAGARVTLETLLVAAQRGSESQFARLLSRHETVALLAQTEADAQAACPSTLSLLFMEAAAHPAKLSRLLAAAEGPLPKEVALLVVANPQASASLVEQVVERTPDRRSRGFKLGFHQALRERAALLSMEGGQNPDDAARLAKLDTTTPFQRWDTGLQQR